LLIVLMSVLNRRSLDEPDQNGATNNVAATGAPAPAPAAERANVAAATAPASGPVVLTATGPAWIQVTDQGKTLFQGELQSGQSYTVPATVTAPMLKAGKPEALKVTVGTTTAPPVGPPGKVTTVSLNPSDLLKGPAAPASAAAPQAAPAARHRAERAPAAPPAAPPPVEPVTNSQ
jgi:hypothetical protein